MYVAWLTAWITWIQGKWFEVGYKLKRTWIKDKCPCQSCASINVLTVPLISDVFKRGCAHVHKKDAGYISKLLQSNCIKASFSSHISIHVHDTIPLKEHTHLTVAVLFQTDVINVLSASHTPLKLCGFKLNWKQKLRKVQWWILLRKTQLQPQPCNCFFFFSF